MRFFLLSAVASLGGLLFGYDTGVISGALLFLRARFALSPTMQDVVTGVVLVGDAAGFNDPLGGQGLAIALRDVRLVSALLAGAERIDTALLAPYIEERRERMRRLRVAVSALAQLRVEFAAEKKERRMRALARFATRPELAATFTILSNGPESGAAEAFTPQHIAELLA